MQIQFERVSRDEVCRSKYDTVLDVVFDLAPDEAIKITAEDDYRQYQAIVAGLRSRASQRGILEKIRISRKDGSIFVYPSTSVDLKIADRSEVAVR